MSEFFVFLHHGATCVIPAFKDLKQMIDLTDFMRKECVVIQEFLLMASCVLIVRLP